MISRHALLNERSLIPKNSEGNYHTSGERVIINFSEAELENLLKGYRDQDFSGDLRIDDMTQEQKTSAPIKADDRIDLSLSSFDNTVQSQPQQAREFDYNLLTEGVEVDRSGIVKSLDLNRNYCTKMQSYMIGSGDATDPDQFSAKVRQDAFDLGLKVILETKNAFVSQISPRVSLVFGTDSVADPRDTGIDRGVSAQVLGSSEALIANFARIRDTRNKFMEQNGYALAA